ncbi:MAG: hypothetical protein RQ733_03530 [Methyloprofundus sp.]|nr:hypothetical protein [Methyloprofundus sp.]MDT8425025.1 hypothetical protein [Methyloprofundus sp.]
MKVTDRADSAEGMMNNCATSPALNSRVEVIMQKNDGQDIGVLLNQCLVDE